MLIIHKLILDITTLAFRMEVVLNVPQGVGVPNGRIAGDLLLLEAPLGQLLGAGREDALEEVVMELDLGRDGLDGISLLPANDLNPKHVVGVADAVLHENNEKKSYTQRTFNIRLIKYLAITRDLILLLGERRWLLVGVDVPLGLQMFQPDKISVTDQFNLGLVPLVRVDRGGLIVPLLNQESIYKVVKCQIYMEWFVVFSSH